MINKKSSKWGGFREGAGRKERQGGTAKICVSVNEENWDTAVRIWKKKPSWLVDGLISHYIHTNGSILGTEAAI